MNPKSLSYSMPAEWITHDRTLISWPVQASMVNPQCYEQVCQGYASIINAIAEFEPVTVIVNPEELQQVAQQFEHIPHIDCLPIPHNDAWLRDNGPTFLLNSEKELAGVNWQFNAWGGKYEPWDLDNAVAPQLILHFGAKQFDAPLVMEGGSIHTDGEGTLLTTEECLLHTNRNPDLSKQQIEQQVKQFVNTDTIIWLKRGLSGDETDGHVDNIACFAAPGVVLIQTCHDPADENYVITQENLAILRAATDAKGRKLRIVELPQPPKTYRDGRRLTLSYLNFYFVNGGIILPVFGGAAELADQRAQVILAETFPDRIIRTVDGMAIIGEGGNVHCTTQQVPQHVKKGGGGL